MSIKRQRDNLDRWWHRLPLRTRRDIVVFISGAALMAVLSWLW